MVNFLLQDFLSLVERMQTWYCQKGNVAKGAIFEKLRFSIIILRMKKLPKQDEFGILG
jgi:hypothetical protein